MNELKSQLIEKGEQVVTHPTSQKLISTYAVGAGSAFSLDLIQGVLGIVSVIIGIVAGLFIIVINYRKSKGVKLDNEIKELEKARMVMENMDNEDKNNGDSD